jgi:ribonucleotide reductase beta subunit family protein with ferritin-like domain
MESQDFYDYFPIKQPDLDEMYNKALQAFWTRDEIEFKNEEYEFQNRLDENERRLIKLVLLFFLRSDQIVNINISERFKEDIKDLPKDWYPYIENFYQFQMTMENIHTQVYELLINTYFPIYSQEEGKERNDLSKYNSIKNKSEWAQKWITDEKSNFIIRLIAFAILEGIFFSSSFAIIYWIKTKNILTALTSSNDFIARDEGLHRDFAIKLFNLLSIEPGYEEYFVNIKDVVITMIKEAVILEKEFISEAFNNIKLNGLNKDLMFQYIEHTANHLYGCLDLDGEQIYAIDEQPLSFMENISLTTKTNFFDKRANEYKKSETSNDFSFTLDF